MEYFKRAAFITLTYNNENYTGDFEPDHHVRLFKRLRKRIERWTLAVAAYTYLNLGVLVDLSPTLKIKYFLAAERGTRSTKRAHYHVLILGLSNRLAHMFLGTTIKLSKNPDGSFNWASKQWRYGHVHVGHCVTDKTINYIVGYLAKNDKRNDYYKRRGLRPPYNRQSIGIGRRWLRDNVVGDYIPYKGFPRSIPRYYRNLLGITQWERLPYLVSIQQAMLEQYEKDGLSVNRIKDEKHYKLFYESVPPASYFGGIEQPEDFWQKLLKRSQYEDEKRKREQDHSDRRVFA